MLRANRKGEFSAFLYMFLLVSRIRIKFVNFYKFKVLLASNARDSALWRKRRPGP